MSDEAYVRQILLAADEMREQLGKKANFRVCSTDGYENKPFLTLDEATARRQEREKSCPSRTWEVLPQDKAAEAIMEYDQVVLQLWGEGR